MTSTLNAKGGQKYTFPSWFGRGARLQTSVGYRVFLVGVFLTPFTRVAVIPGLGVSLGDLFLVSGCILITLEGRSSSLIKYRAPVVFLVPGFCIITSTLLSSMFSVGSSTFDTIALISQYSLIMIILPLTFARSSYVELVSAAKAFAYGLTTSILIGMLIVTFLPEVESILRGMGYLYAVGNGRQGLMSGIGELSKMSALTIPLLYWLTRRQLMRTSHLIAVTASLILAIVVTRSASGFLTALSAVLSLLVFHLLLSRKQSNREPRLWRPTPILLASGAGVSFYLLTRLEELGFTYRGDFSARVTDPLLAGALDSVGSTQVRFSLISESLETIARSPLLGTGPGLYLPESAYGQGVHVVPLMLWAETGILAGTGWLLLILFAIAFSVNRIGVSLTGAASAISMLVATLACHVSATYMYGRGLFLPLCISMFLLEVPDQALRLQRILPPRPRRLTKAPRKVRDRS